MKLPAASCMLLRAAWGKAKNEHSVLDEKKNCCSGGICMRNVIMCEFSVFL